MKLKFLFFYFFCFSLSFSQIGVGTLNPASTLEFQGSFGGSYKNVTSSKYQLTENDYSVVYVGVTDGNFE